MNDFNVNEDNNRNGKISFNKSEGLGGIITNNAYKI